MANYRSVKVADDAQFPGLELVKRDNSIVAVVIDHLRIESDYGLRVLVHEPYRTVDRYRVEATIEGFDPVRRFFEHEHEANKAKTTFEERGATVTTEKVKALVDENGNVVGEAAGFGADADLDTPIPF